MPAGAGAARRVNRPMREVAAPGGARRAVVFWRECGPPAPEAGTMVSVLRAGAPFSGEAARGNVFRRDALLPDGQRAPAGADAAWAADTVLVIRYRLGARVLLARPRYDGVAVRYTPLGSDVDVGGLE